MNPVLPRRVFHIAIDYSITPTSINKHGLYKHIRITVVDKRSTLSAQSVYSRWHLLFNSIVPTQPTVSNAYARVLKGRYC